jgi:hypothetical protein
MPSKKQMQKRIVLQISKTNSTKPGKIYLMRCICCGKEFSLMGKLYNKGLGIYCGYSCAGKDRFFSESTRTKMSERLKGNKIRVGCKMSEESKLKIGKFSTGRHPSVETRRKLSKWQIGKNNPNWKNGITNLAILIRCLEKNSEIRNQTFQRDDYTCQECGAKSGKGKHIELEAHHVYSFSQLLTEFLTKNIRLSPTKDKEILIELALEWKPFWNIDNMETLCSDCHDKTRGRRKRNG